MIFVYINSIMEKEKLNKQLYKACLIGDKKLVESLILIRNFNINDFHYGFSEACEGGHIDIINLMIEKGVTDWNYGLARACKRGHREIIDMMINKGANNWNWGLSEACREGHID